MICPECGSEYREGYVRCGSCEIDLIEPTPVEPEIELVKVYETGNPALIPVVESLLDDAGIEYMTKNESIQDLFGWGRFPSSISYAIGPVEFYVREDAADEARAIVETLESPEVAPE
jgi:hypothetical protein